MMTMMMAVMTIVMMKIMNMSMMVIEMMTMKMDDDVDEDEMMMVIMMFMETSQFQYFELPKGAIQERIACKISCHTKQYLYTYDQGGRKKMKCIQSMNLSLVA